MKPDVALCKLYKLQRFCENLEFTSHQIFLLIVNLQSVWVTVLYVYMYRNDPKFSDRYA